MATTSASDIVIDARCEISGKTGTIRFVGTTDFAPGKWVGVELDDPSGKNNGSVNGKHYFDCKPNHGVFVRSSQVKLPVSSAPSNSIPQLRNPSTPSFAPPNSNDAPLRQRPASMIFPSSNRNSVSGIPNRLSRGPGSFGRGPNSPTFQQRRPRGYSDASNPDQKRLDFDSMYFNNPEDYVDDENIDEDEPGVSAPKSDVPKYSETPKHETANAPDPFSLQETREQTVSQKEYDELRMKLKILENKRQEDRERLRETDKMRADAEQILSFKPKLQEMQQELRELRKQLKEVNSEKEAFEGKYNEAAESMEIMAIDKEVAEEKADQLQQEVNLLKEKIEEISVDLTVFKKHESGLSDEARQAIEYAQLEKQNERLKEALFSESEADLNKKIKALEKELSSLQDIQVQRDQTKNQLDAAEIAIEDLKSRLDAVMHNEDMLEQLTQQNLMQGEQIEEMKMTIEDLEALKELNDELEESHIENEKQLQAEIDHKDMLIREYLRRIESTDEANADYENTISNFRELVATLQSDLEQFRRKEENQNSETDNLSSESQKMHDLRIKLSTTELKNQAKQIDLELRKLDATQASENLKYVQPYLPETFFSTENDSIQCLLLLQRLVFKSELIIKQIDQKHNIAEKLNTTVPEQLIAVCELRQKLAWFSDLSKRFITFINGCPVETFLKMGQVYHDLIGTERRINSIVELLKKEELKESENIEVVQRSIAQLEHFAERYLSSTNLDEADKFHSYTRTLDLNADTIAVTLGHLKQAVATACKDEEIIVSDTPEEFHSEFFQPLQALITQSRNSKVMVRKMLLRLDDLTGQSSCLKSDILAQFKTCYSLSTKLSNFCFEVWKGVSDYINGKKGTKDELQLVGLHQIIYTVTESILSVNEMKMWDGCIKSLQDLCQEIGNLNNVINDPDKAETVAKHEAPWVIRSKELKAEVIINVDMERKLQQSGEKMQELLKDMKLKDQALQEAGVKIELLERRVEIVKQQADRINSLEQELANKNKQESDFEEVMGKLHQDIENLAQQHQQSSTLIANLDGKELQSEQPIRPHEEDDLGSDGMGMISEASPFETQHLTSQIESLKLAVRYLRAENSHLKGKEALGVLNWHLQPKRPRNIQNQNNSEELSNIAQEAKSLLKDLHSKTSSPRVVSITKTLEDKKKWQSVKKTPIYQYQIQQSVMYTLQKRSNDLKSKLQQLGKTNQQKSQKPSKNGIVDTRPSLVGRIRLPLLDSPNNMHSHNINIKNPSDFEKIHTIFVN
ncbi:37730_t:CDS:10 [Gigaspora margarita]|uniref:37730_t:CDS:1 n=1 Tax=Gigaspora margarita TaxID=4874 RepID=A0ABN7VA09_GIGMA|nr:37730_t:CDS:10 [Gigaspora margarita]